ncbi:P-loop containing nucleoside triphosphate hydrolase protein [Limtongia smithiae]|uniref:P-loop containing nucleoside triphosphate hydrolase protein n=1 Tax=Limtongia smithiae TaxID=1125753 RepID=UPI0034CFB3F4
MGCAVLSAGFYTFNPCFSAAAFPLLLAAGLICVAPREYAAIKQSAAVFRPHRNWIYFQIFLSVVVASAVIASTVLIAIKHGVDLRLYAAIVYIVALAVAQALEYFEYPKVRIQSTPVLLFWTLSLVMWLSNLYGQAQRERAFDAIDILLSLLVTCTVAGHLIVSLFVARPRSQYSAFNDEPNRAMMADAHILSRLTFSYANRLINLGYETVLTEDDLPNAPSEFYSGQSEYAFEDEWRAECDTNMPSIVKVLMRCYKSPTIAATIFKLLADIFLLAQPRLLRELIIFVELYSQTSEHLSGGIAIAIALLVCSILHTLFREQYNACSCGMSLYAKWSLPAAVYRKNLRMLNQEDSIGAAEILVSVDIPRIRKLIASSADIFSLPLRVLVCLYYLRKFIGNSMWAGVFVAVFAVLMNARFMRKRHKWHNIQLSLRNIRRQFTRRVLFSIKPIKLYSWGNYFTDRLQSLRQADELGVMEAKNISSTLIVAIESTTSVFVLLAALAALLYTTDTLLTTDIVFPSFLLFSFLTSTLAETSAFISNFLSISTSLQRLQNYLLSPEIQLESITHLDAAVEGPAILLHEATFSWTDTSLHDEVINEVSWTVGKGDCACVVGRSASGKSALLKALLGDLYRTSGSASTSGSIAYCSQNPWIMSASIKENILLGKRYHADLYDRAVSACCLAEDFSILPDGDETLVDDVSLTECQKQRVSIARAIYSRADIYLFDDSLTAISDGIASRVIDGILGPNGLLVSKTKIIATSSSLVLAYSTSITVLEDGEVEQSLTYIDVVRDLKSPVRSIVIGDFPDDRAKEISVQEDTESLLETPTTPGRRRGVSISSLHLSMATEALTTRRSTYFVDRFGPGHVKFNAYRELAGASGSGSVFLFFFLMIIAYSLLSTASWWLKIWTNEHNNFDFYNEPDDSHYLSVFMSLTVGSVVFLFMAIYVLQTRCLLRASTALHDRMITHVIGAPLSFFYTELASKIMNRISHDGSRVDDHLSDVLTAFFSCALRLLFAFFIISAANPAFIVFAAPAVFVFYLIYRVYAPTSRQVKVLLSLSQPQTDAHFASSLAGASTIRAYSSTTKFITAHETLMDRTNRSAFIYMLLRRWLSIRLEVLGSCLMLISTILALVTVANENLSAALVGLTILYSLQLIGLSSEIAAKITEVRMAMTPVQRVLDYCNVALEGAANNVAAVSNLPEGWPSRGAVEFHDYSTRYRNGLDLSLKGINLKIKPEEKIGIVGQPGSGKTSLLLALFRMIEPVGGFISIDGVNTSKITLQELRKHLAIMPQEPYLFEGTIRENLDPMCEYADDQIWRVLQLSHLRDHVSQLNGLLQARVMDGGLKFTPGERQLFSLARALLSPSKILIVEQAATIKDAVAFEIIQETIHKEFTDRTIITISNRLDIVMDSDRVAVLTAGKIAEFDAPRTLLANKRGQFYALCKQAGIA